MKNFEKFMERIDDTPYDGLDCEGFLKNVYQDKNFECPSYDCYVCLAKAMKYLNEECKEPLLSHDEYVILKNLPSELKYITRDESRLLCVFKQKPSKNLICRNEKGAWASSVRVKIEASGKPYLKYAGYDFELFSHLFQFIKWEDDEPYEIAKLIADYEKEHQDE